MPGTIDVRFGYNSAMRRLVFFFVLLPLLAAQTMKEVEITSEPSHHLALENSYVRVFKVEVAPHAATLLHRHRHDYVFVSLGLGHISNEVEGKPPVEIRLADGEVRFTDGNFAHVARNLADQPFRNVAIELLQDGKLRQTSSRWPMEGGDKTFPEDIARFFSCEMACAFPKRSSMPGRPFPAIGMTDRICWLRSAISICGVTSRVRNRNHGSSTRAMRFGCAMAIRIC